MLRFGPFELDPANRRLTKGSASVALPPKCFDLLCLLASRAGSLVTKEEISQSLWPGVHVEDTAIARLVSELRRALDDSASSPAYIHTVPKAGYRFEGLIPESQPKPAPPAPTPRRQVPRIVWIAAAILAGAAAFFGFRDSSHVPYRTIAVLPVHSLAGTPEDRLFCLGLTHLAISQLAPGLTATVLPASATRSVEDHGHRGRGGGPLAQS